MRKLGPSAFEVGRKENRCGLLGKKIACRRWVSMWVIRANGLVVSRWVVNGTMEITTMVR